MKRLPRVAIVGRPNVGKSTLFNRIVGRRHALVDDAPGVTRDRLEAEAEWAGVRFALVDTGGFEAEREAGLPGRIREHSLRAAAEADLVLFVVDGRAGVSPADAEAARVLAATGKPILLVVNKIDGPGQEPQVWDFFRLGLGEPQPVSAEVGTRLDELLDRLIERLSPVEAPEGAPATRLAILGRPNVGKSSILNRLVREERMLVDAAAGTTRDAVDTPIEVDGRRYVLVDTAGIRRRSRIDDAIERASVARAFRALERADVALLVIDAAEGVTDQEARLARLAWERGRGLLLVVNKWDLLPHREREPEKRLAAIRRRFPHFAHVPAVFVSALRGTHLEDVFPAVRRVEEALATRIPTRLLNRVLEEAAGGYEPPLVRGRRARVYYAAATGSRPPRVTLFVNDPEIVSKAHLRYLENRLRAAIPLEGAPLRLSVRARPRTARSARAAAATPGVPRTRAGRG